MEIEEKIVSVAHNLMVDGVYTIDDAIPELIKVIEMLELEHRTVMNEILKIQQRSN